MKRLLIAPGGAQQAKRNKPQRFKQRPTSWWSALRSYLKRLKRAARPSSASCQAAVRPPPHQSAPIKTLPQKIYSKQQLWQRLKGPSTNSNLTLNSNITSSFAQPLVNFSLRLSPAIPAGSRSLAHRGLTTLPINHPNLKVSGISFRATGIDSLLRSLKPLPLMIPTRAITCSFSTLPESQYDQKKPALVLPKRVNYLPSLPPIIMVNKPPQPLNPSWQWLANKTQVIDPAVEMTKPSSKKSASAEEEIPEKKIQKLFIRNRCKVLEFFKTSDSSYNLRKRRSPYLFQDQDSVPPPKKRAKRASNSDPYKTSVSLLESENKVICPSAEITHSSLKTDSSTEKWSGSELSNPEPSETAIEDGEDAWCYQLAAYGYDTQRYPLLTQLPDDCYWGERILRDFELKHTFWLDLEEKSLLYGARHFPKLTEFFQINPLTYHPYLEQSINAHATASESLPSSTKVANSSDSQSLKISPLLNHCLIG